MDVLKNTVKSASVIMIVLDGNQVILSSNTYTYTNTTFITLYFLLNIEMVPISLNV